MMFIFAFRLKLSIVQKIHNVFVLNTLIMPFTGIKEKKKLTGSKREKSKFFSCIKYDTDCKKQYFYP